MITVLSTLHHNDRVQEGHPKKLPDIIDFYNHSNAGVHTIDQLVGAYSCKGQTHRWPIALFSNIDLSALNGLVIWGEIKPQWNATKRDRRRIYLAKLGEDLARDHMISRERMPRSSTSANIVRALQRPDLESTGLPQKKKKVSTRVTCAVCPPQIRRKAYEHCSVCEKPVCPQHRTTTTVSTSYCEEHTRL